MALCERRIFVFGGLSQRQIYLNDIYSYDLDLKFWSKLRVKGEPPLPRESASVVLYESNLILFGGKNGKRLNDLHLFNTSSLPFKSIFISDLSNFEDPLSLDTFRWSTLDTVNCPLGRSLHTAVVSEGKMLVFGGWVEDDRGRSVCSNNLLAFDIGSLLLIHYL